jgi:hypothetical protein
VKRLPSQVPKLALRVGEAAQALSVSEDFFAGHIACELRWVRYGSLKIVPVKELDRWLESNASRVLDEAS